MPKGGIYAIRLLTKNVVLFFNYIDKYLIHLQYEFRDQTNNRQTFAIVSWRHANSFFRDIEPVIFVSCAWLEHQEKIFSPSSSFDQCLGSILFIFSSSSFSSLIMDWNDDIPIKRTSFDFLPSLSVGRWMKAKTNDSSSWEYEYTRRILQLILK
jgi:hypothetical protein